jgi:hypothetical protein
MGCGPSKHILPSVALTIARLNYAFLPISVKELKLSPHQSKFRN